MAGGERAPRVAATYDSPLASIERAVQERAKQISLDMATDDGAAKLAALIDDEVAAWTDDDRHGRREFDLADPDLVAERARRNLLGYGPLAPLLDDPDVWEIMVNGPAQIFVKRHRGPSGYHDEVFHDDALPVTPPGTSRMSEVYFRWSSLRREAWSGIRTCGRTPCSQR